MKSESKTMALLRRIGWERAAWSMRRLHCPVEKKSLVLEVGSGGNPFPRANVLLDAYEDTRERHWAPLVSDRPTVLGFVENLPFKDGSFDFVIAAHVLEHSAHPEGFLAELQRVSKAGYIETPDALMERLNPYRDHRLEVQSVDGELVIRKKIGWIQDMDLYSIYERRAKPLFANLVRSRPFEFHVRFFWTAEIRHKVLNPECDASWTPAMGASDSPTASLRASLREGLLRAIRWLFSQNARNRSIDLSALLRCPGCKGGNMKMTSASVECMDCTQNYSVKNGIPMMCLSETQ